MNNKKSIRTALFCFAVTLVLAAFCSYTIIGTKSTTNNNSYPYAVRAEENFEIRSYSVNINVEKNNTMHIEENISVEFFETCHGIYRDIPLENDIRRADGSTSKTRARISDISCNEKYSTSVSDNNKRIRIGDEDSLVDGYQDYSISYTYSLSNDTNEGFDEFYFNVIGTGWGCSISDVDFTITMPTEVDRSKLGGSFGSYGSDKTDGLILESHGKNIYGTFSGTLNPGEGINVRLELPDGYFIPKTDYSIFICIIALCVFGLFVLAGFVIWFVYGKDDKVIETVQFYPPEGYNSADIGVLYKGKIEKKDITSLIVYLANKGYIQVQSDNYGFRLTKLRDYNGNNSIERNFLNGLFKNKNSVDKSDLKYKFYTTIDKIAVSLKELLNRAFYKQSAWRGILLGFFALLSIIIAQVIPLVVYGEDVEMYMLLIFSTIGIIAVFVSFIQKEIMIRAFLLIWGIGFGSAGYVFVIMAALACPIIVRITSIAGIFASFALMLFMKLLPKRTAYGTEVYGKILGFRRFLTTCEKQELQQMVYNNPTYYYDILPFTYVLGVTNIFMKQFEGIELPPPNWYYGNAYYNGYFDRHEFNRFMNSTMSQAGSAMTVSHSSSSSGGSSSGGGFSGGGSGGGGGGSW